MTETTHANKILFFKEIDGERVPHALLLDSNRNYVDIVELPKKEAPPAPTKQMEDLQRRGYEVVQEANGGLRVTGISEELQTIMNFFSDLAPCWFDGCEDLRKEYKSELDTLEEGGNCKDCDRGALIRKYQDLVRKAMNGG